MKLEAARDTLPVQADRGQKGVQMVRTVVHNHAWKFPSRGPAGPVVGKGELSRDGRQGPTRADKPVRMKQ